MGMLNRLDETLSALEHAQLVRRDPEDQATFGFKHLLTQEAAYHSLLLKSRGEIHRRVAEAYERLYSDRLDDYAALLARHWQDAGDDGKTLDYATRAADRAAHLYAEAEALDLYSLAIRAALKVEAAAREHPRLIYLYSRKGRTLELMGRFADALGNYAEMEQRANEYDDRAMLLACLLAQARIRCTTNREFDAAIGEAVLTRALALARDLGDRAAESAILWNWMNLHRMTNHAEQSLEAGEQSLAIARSLNLKEQTAFTLNDLSHAYAFAALPEKEVAALKEAAGLWRELDNRPMLADTLGTLSRDSIFAGDFDRGLELSDEAFAISESIGNLWGQSYSRMSVGLVYYQRGEIQRAIETVTESLARADQVGFTVARINAQPMLALAYAFLGDAARGRGLMEDTLRLTHDRFPLMRPIISAQWIRVELMEDHLVEAKALLDEAWPLDRPNLFSFPLKLSRILTLQALGDYGQAVDAAEDLIQLGREKHSSIVLAETLHAKGQSLVQLGRMEEGRESLQAARVEAESRSLRIYLPDILKDLADLELRLGNREAAGRLRERARENVLYIADHAPPEYRERYLRLPRTRRILEDGE